MAEKKDYRIALIVCWMGALPEYFPLWLKSCECNPNIDFLIYSDQRAVDLPSNVKMIPATLESIRTKIADKVDLPPPPGSYTHTSCAILNLFTA